MSEQFAFGNWTVGGVACPIATAGCDERSFAIEVAELFDDFVSEEIDEDVGEGIVGYQIAKQQWQRMKSTVDDNREDPKDEPSEHRFNEMYDVIVEVENEVFEED